MNPSAGSAPVADAFDRWAPRILSALVVASLLGRGWLALDRLYDPDELEHLHAGYCVWQGMVPYRDFFEQHGPVLWYLSWPLFAVWGDSLAVLTAGRFLMWFFGLGTVAFTWHLGNRLHGRWGGPIAALLLVSLPGNQEKGIEWRPDNVAVPLVLAAIVCWLRSVDSGRRVWLGLAGVSLAAAFVATQKVAYVGTGIGLAYLVVTIARRARVTDWIWPIAGACSALLITLAVFAAQSAAAPYLEMTIAAPLRWKTYEPVWPLLSSTLMSAPVFWSAAVAGLTLTASDVRRRTAAADAGMFVALGAVAHAAGLLFVPAALLQYYLPLGPLAALLGARAITHWVGSTQVGTAADCPLGWWGRAAVVLAAAAIASLLLLRLRTHTVNPHLPLLDLSTWCTIGGAALVAAAILASSWTGRAGPAAAGRSRWITPLVLATTIVAAGPFLALHFRWGDIRTQQARRIEQLTRATAPDDRFLDGFTGYAALRPHAFFYFWINDHSWPMIPPPQRHSGVLTALADPRTRVVLFDEYLNRHLGDDAKWAIAANYLLDPRYSDATCKVYVRRERSLP